MKIATHALLVSLLLVCVCAVYAHGSGDAGTATGIPPSLDALKDSSSAMMTKYIRPGFSSSAFAIGSRSALLGHHLQSRALDEEACVEDCCSPCFGGLDPTNPNGTIHLGLNETMTCEDYGAMAGIYPSNHESCPVAQLIGHTFCGCPSPPLNVCTLCYDGSAVPDPDLIFDPFGDGNSFSCGEIVLDLLDLDDDTCSVIQNTAGVLCGCPASPDPPLTCNICPAGSIISNPDEFIGGDGDGDADETCGDFASYAGYMPANDENCALIRDAASLAGCCSDTAPSPGVMQSAAPSTSPDGFIVSDQTTEPSSTPTPAPSSTPTPAPSSCPELPTPVCNASRVEITLSTGDIPSGSLFALFDDSSGEFFELGGPYTAANGTYTAATSLCSGSYSLWWYYEGEDGMYEPGKFIAKVDGVEVASGYAKDYTDSSAVDTDEDGVSDTEEMRAGTDPLDPMDVPSFVSFTIPTLPPPSPPGHCVGSRVETTINTDQFPDEIAWAIFDDSDGSNVDSGGPYTTEYESYTTSTCLGAGSYTFIVYDGYGDGMEESGGYHVKVDGKEVVSGGSDYGCGESKSFTVPSYEYYDIPVMDLSFSFGGEEGNFIRYDCVLDLPDYDVIVLDNACQTRVDAYFGISTATTARSDGSYDAAVNLDILPETMTNPLLFDDSDEENIMYKGCVRIELIRGDDGRPVFFRQKAFHITLDMTTGFSSSFESSGADEEGDTVEGEISNDLEAFVCDEVGNRYEGPISMSSFGHYFCFEPSENVAIVEISTLVFEKLGGDSFTAIQDGLEDVDVYRIRDVEGGDNVLQVHLRLPNGFFYSDDTISVSGEVLSTPDVGRRLGNEAAESGSSFFLKVAVQPRTNGMVQTEYTASLTVSGMVVPQGPEDVRAAARAFERALENIIPDGILAKTLSIGLEDVPYLRTSRRMDEEDEVEIVFSLNHMIPCEDADCVDVETLSAEAFEASRDSIEISVADGTLDDAIHEAAATYSVAGLDAVKVNSESVTVSEPNVEVLSTSSTTEESSRSTSVKTIVASTMSALAVLALGTYFISKRKRNEEDEDSS